MDRCPTCGAKQRGGECCHRCKTDLTPLLDVESRAEEHRNKAITAFQARDFEGMYIHARRARALCREPGSDRLLATAAVLSGNFGLAISLWNR